MNKRNLSKVSSFLLANLIVAGVFFGIPKKTLFNNINTQTNLNEKQNNLAAPATPAFNSVQIVQNENDDFIFDPFYFEGDLNKLWQKNLNYKKALEIKSQSIIDFKFLANLLNQKKLIFEKGFSAGTLKVNAFLTLKTMASGLVKILFNNSADNDDYAKIGNLIYQFHALLNEIKNANFIIDDDFKARFSTAEKAADELAKRVNSILGSNSDIQNNQDYKKILDQITKIEKENVVSRQTTLLKKLFYQYPKWFIPNDKIDVNNNWDTKWENEYKLNLIKIIDLIENLNQQKIKIDQVAKALKRYILQKKSLVVELSTDKNYFIGVEIPLTTNYYYNPVANIKFNNKLLFSEIVGLLSDFLRYIYLNSQTIDQKNILLSEWDVKKINAQTLEKINDVLFRLIYKVKIYFDVKKLTIPEFFNSPPETKKELNLLEILSIYSSLYSTINNNFLANKIKEEIAKNDSVNWIIDLKNQIAKLAKVRISNNILLQPDDFKEIIDSDLQKRIISLLKANNANLRQIYQKIADGSQKTNVYYDKNIVENLKIKKYISDPEAEKKNFLLVNIFDKSNFNDYNLLLRYEQGAFKIIYFGKSFFQKQYKSFIEQENASISNTQLNLKFSSYPEIKDKILLIKEYKMILPERFNLKGEDFENDGKIKNSKLIDRNFTNEQRNAVWNMKIKDLNDILYDKVINKLIEIKAKYDSLSADLQKTFENVLTSLNIDVNVLTNDVFYLYKNAQLKTILDLKMATIESLIYFFDLQSFFNTNKENISFLKLLSIDMFQTLDIKLEDFNFEGKFVNAEKIKSFQEKITKTQVDEIKSKLSATNINAEFKKQSAANQKTISYMQIFLRLKNTLLLAEPTIFSLILEKIGISLNEVTTNQGLYQKIVSLTSIQKNELELFGSLNVLNKYYELNKNDLARRTYSLVYWDDIKTNWKDYGTYYWENTIDQPFKNGSFKISDASKVLIAKNYNQSNTLTEDEKTFLRRMFVLRPFKEGWDDSFEPVYENSYYWRTNGVR